MEPQLPEAAVRTDFTCFSLQPGLAHLSEPDIPLTRIMRMLETIIPKSCYSNVKYKHHSIYKLQEFIPLMSVTS